MAQLIDQDLVVLDRRRKTVDNLNHFEVAGEMTVCAMRCHLSFLSLASVPVSARGHHKHYYRGALSRSDHPGFVIGMRLTIDSAAGWLQVVHNFPQV
jgi:hypothetical protein